MYSCDVGRKLQRINNTNGISQTIEVDSQTITCEWDGNWSPSQVEVCVWIECIAPVIAPGSHTVSNYTSPVQFGAYIYFECEGPDYFFENDRDKQGFLAQCRSDGSYSPVGGWSNCKQDAGQYI